MRIAIVGAGLAGLATCYFLSLYPNVEATVFDPKGIAQGASGVSTGLLHPFVGRRALYSWRAMEGMQATLDLVDLVEGALGVAVAERRGIFRPAITEQQIRDFPKAAFKFSCLSPLHWIDHPEFEQGLWIPEGIAIYARPYLDGLWQVCQSLGAKSIQEKITSYEALEAFDQIVVAAGFETTSLPGCTALPLEPTKGQTAIFNWQQRPSCSLVSQGHITPTEKSERCQIGSTYETAYTHPDPEIHVGLSLKMKAAKFYPPAQNFELIEVRAGIRTSRPKGYRPIVQKISDKVWVFAGLGSRGMLYHAYLGKALAEAVIHERPSLFPLDTFKSCILTEV